MKTWSFRACALTAALLVLAPIFVPLSVHADIANTVVLCNSTSAPQVTGQGLANFERVDYSSDGWAQFHFKFEPSATTHHLYILFNRKYASSCNTKGFYIFHDTPIPDTVDNFSIRTSSYSEYQFYDDDTNQPLTDCDCHLLMPPPLDADVSDHVMFQMALGDNSGSLLSTSHPFWDPSRPLPPRPVIIIPGATGTTLTKGSDTLWPNASRMASSSTDDFMDALAFNSDLSPTDIEVGPGQVIDRMELLNTIPVFDYTEGLIETLTAAGYQKDKNLFIFPYDWRQSVQNSSSKLSVFINQVQLKTGFWYLNAIAHSMGGLVLKQYVNNTPYGHIDKAVFVGTPFLGAPKALKTLLYGDNLGVPVLSAEEIKKISTNMPGLYQLLPSRFYFNRIGSALGLTQPMTYDQTEDFGSGQGLNATAWQLADNWHSETFDTFDMGHKGVNVYNVVGCASPTLSQLRQYVLPSGRVEGMSPVFTWGDGTVPTLSAIATPLDAGKTIYALKGEHARLLSAPGVSKQIVRLLNGDTRALDPNLTTEAGRCGLSGRLISVFSPVDITATDNAGAVVGRLPNGQIRQDVLNSGYEELGDHKFLFWPDDAPAPSITLQGTDTGTFTLSVGTIKNNQSMSTATYTDVPVTQNLRGQINLANDSSLSLDVNNDGQPDQTLLPTTVTTTLPPAPQDTTAPEINLSFDPSAHSLIFAGTDETSTATTNDQGPQITATDAAGNTTVIKIDRQEGKKSLKAQLLNLSYNGQTTAFAGAKLSYAWASDNLTQELTIGDIMIKATYDGKNTKITIKPSTGKGQQQSVAGLALLKIKTDKGSLSWSW